MKLRNKKTGEIRKARIIDEHLQLWEEVLNDWVDYDDLDYLAHYWERYEEPKEYWHIFGTNVTHTQKGLDKFYDKMNKEIGNYFETKEEADKAVEKLKAWKRLKDKGFKFIGVRGIGKVIDFDIPEPFNHVGFYEYVAGVDETEKEFYNDLLLLFGGEE